MNVSTFTTSTSNGNTGGSALSPFSSSESPHHQQQRQSFSQHRVQPSNRQRFPPLEIDIVKRRPLALCKSGTSKDPKPTNVGPMGSSGRSNWSSGRSIASSITFYDDFSVEVGDKVAAFEPDLFISDSKPDLPERQGSGYLKACEEEGGHDDDDYDDDDEGAMLRDSPPNKPRRRLSFASMASSIAGSTLSGRKSSRRKSSSSDAAIPENTFTPTCSSNMPTCSPLFTTASENFKDDTQDTQNSKNTSSTDQVLKQLSQKAAAFRKLVEVKHRKYAMRTFKNCFVGSEAVDVMLKAGLAHTRDEAVQLGRDMVRYLQLFHHVTQGHNFKDKTLFYRFLDDEPRCLAVAPVVAAVASDCGDSLSSSNHQRPWFAFRRTRTIQEGSPLSLDDLQRVPPIMNSNRQS